MKYLVNFKGVGRDKRSWTASVNEISHTRLYREVKKRGGIMSRGIDFVTDEATNTGVIVVGFFRTVGTFSWSLQNQD